MNQYDIVNQLTALSSKDCCPQGVSADQWRTYVIVAYFTGLRACDLRRLGSENMNFDSGTVSLTLAKTGRTVCLSLHPIAAAHLQCLALAGGTIFGFIPKPTGVAPELRRIAHDAIEAVSSGAGQALLCHLGADMNLDDLRAAVAAMPFPAAWKGGEA